MITNIVKNKKNYFILNYFDNASEALSKNTFSIKTDNDIYIEVANDLNFLQIRFSTLELQKFKYFDFMYENADKNYFTHYKLEYSLDNSYWYELPWKKDINGTEEIYYKKIKYKENGSEEEHVFKYTDLNDLTKCELLNNDEVPPTSGLQYFYTKINLNDEEEYIYNDIEFKFFKITFYNITPPTTNAFIISDINIACEETIENIDLNILETTSTNYYNQRFFETEDFYPIQIKSFLNMLEKNDERLKFDLSIEINEVTAFGIGYLRINSDNSYDRFIIG